MNNTPVTHDDLNRYVDSELPAEDMARIEAWLAENPEDSAMVHSWRSQKNRMHEVYDSILDEAIPPDMLTLLDKDQRRKPFGHTSSWMRMAASIAILLLGGGGGWFLHGWQSVNQPYAATSFVQQAVGAHRVFVSEVRHPVEVGADQQNHLVAWLSKRLGTPLRAPDITATGYSLVGGRLLSANALPVALFMYENATGNRLTIYVRATDTEENTAFRFDDAEGLNAFYWVDDRFAYALTGPVARADLMTIAHKVFADFNQPAL